jgi:hypothetical protein
MVDKSKGHGKAPLSPRMRVVMNDPTDPRRHQGDPTRAAADKAHQSRKTPKKRR